MGELFYWLVMVIGGWYFIHCMFSAVGDMLKGDWTGVIISVVFAVLAWNLHKWAFIHLAPLQTLF